MKFYMGLGKASTDHKVTIEERNKIVFNNVAVGEVWLCAG